MIVLLFFFYLHSRTVLLLLSTPSILFQKSLKYSSSSVIFLCQFSYTILILQFFFFYLFLQYFFFYLLSHIVFFFFYLLSYKVLFSSTFKHSSFSSNLLFYLLFYPVLLFPFFSYKRFFTFYSSSIFSYNRSTSSTIFLAHTSSKNFLLLQYFVIQYLYNSSNMH